MQPNASPLTLSVAPGLFLIPLDQDMPGFVAFIGAWVVRDRKNYLVDPGPAATIPRLIQALESISVTRLDAILLTHIHLDHAGGVAELAEHFPGTPVVCHPSAVRHLTDPSRLWEGSLKTLGATARAYGPIGPVAPDRIVETPGFADPEVLVTETPGHAVHHVSYRVGGTLFAGEAAGVYHRLNNRRFYLRPATPPRFFLETHVRSIDALEAVDHDTLCFGHFGMTRDTPAVLGVHREQIHRWARVIRLEMERGSAADRVDRCTARLLEQDPLLAGYPSMDESVQARERMFIANSVRGFLGYFEQEGR